MHCHMAEDAAGAPATRTETETEPGRPGGGAFDGRKCDTMQCGGQSAISFQYFL